MFLLSQNVKRQSFRQFMNLSIPAIIWIATLMSTSHKTMASMDTTNNPISQKITNHQPFNNKQFKQDVLEEIQSFIDKHASVPPPSNLDYTNQKAWQFLQGLANSRTFVQKYWHKQPLLLRNRELQNMDHGG